MFTTVIEPKTFYIYTWGNTIRECVEVLSCERGGNQVLREFVAALKEDGKWGEHATAIVRVVGGEPTEPGFIKEWAYGEDTEWEYFYTASDEVSMG